MKVTTTIKSRSHLSDAIAFAGRCAASMCESKGKDVYKFESVRHSVSCKMTATGNVTVTVTDRFDLPAGFYE